MDHAWRMIEDAQKQRDIIHADGVRTKVFDGDDGVLNFGGYHLADQFKISSPGTFRPKPHEVITSNHSISAQQLGLEGKISLEGAYINYSLTLQRRQIQRI